MQDTGQLLSDVIARLQNLENRRVPVAQPVNQSTGLGITLLPAQVTLFEETITADKPWTDSGSRRYVPDEAKFALVWAGIKDTTDGVGQSTVEARGADSTITISEIYEPASDSPQNGFNQCIVPVSLGRFDFRVTLAAGASNLLYKIELVGYIT